MVTDLPIGAAVAGAAGPTNLLGQGTPAVARPEDVAMFEAALKPGAAPSVAADPVQLATLKLAPPSAAEMPVPSLGQDILNGLNSVRAKFDTTAADIRGLLDSSGGALDTRQMLDLQMQISTLTVQQELMGKIVGKATQNVDQMLKAQ